MSEDCQHDFVVVTQVTDSFVVTRCAICGKTTVGLDPAFEVELFKNDG